jgi:lysophospholipase L1-like esterase
MRLSLPVTAVLLTTLCACATSTPTTSAAYEPYTCIPAPRLPATSTAPPGAHQLIGVIGDSYTSGSPQGGNGVNRWTARVTDDLKQQGIDVVIYRGSEGGSGYVQKGRNTGEVFADKVKEAVKPSEKLLIFFGSRNDSKATEGEMAHATCDTLRSAEMAAPEARLLVIGTPWVNGNVPAYVLRNNNILRDRTQALGGTFIDPVTDGWFVDRPDLIGADGVHPTDAGHVYMAQKIEPAIEKLLTAPPAK